MPDRTIRITLALTLEDADVAAIRATATDDFGVDAAADVSLPDVIAAIIGNTLEAQFLGFGVPMTVVGVTASETEG